MADWHRSASAWNPRLPARRLVVRGQVAVRYPVSAGSADKTIYSNYLRHLHYFHRPRRIRIEGLYLEPVFESRTHTFAASQPGFVERNCALSRPRSSHRPAVAPRSGASCPSIERRGPQNHFCCSLRAWWMAQEMSYWASLANKHGAQQERNRQRTMLAHGCNHTAIDAEVAVPSPMHAKCLGRADAHDHGAAAKYL